MTDDTERFDGYSGYERATALFNQRLGTEDEESTGGNTKQHFSSTSVATPHSVSA